MLTEVQLAAKRHERTMIQREKRLDRLRSQHLQAETERRARLKRGQWMADLGKSQQDAAKALEDRHRQALESRRAKAAIPKHHPESMITRVKSFFRRMP